MAKRRLTDRSIKALKPDPSGKQYEVMDTLVPGFGVRVSGGGKRTFILIARFPGSANPTRRALGAYFDSSLVGADAPNKADGALTLEEARNKAREWHALIARGVDPTEERKRRRQAQQRKRDTTFGSVMEDYIARHLNHPREPKRKAKDAEREIRRELVPAWRDIPVADITRNDVRDLIEELADRAPYQAHNVFGHVRSFFNWAIGRGYYGLEISPCDRLKPKTLIGEKKPRERVLDDDELVAFWRATGRMGYPFGDFYRLLLLTGQRKTDCSDARWREFDLKRRLWTIPAERFKMDRDQVVPFSDAVVAVLESLPRFRGDYLFTTTSGEKPIDGFSKAKARLDRMMLEILKEFASAEDSDPQSVELEGFVNHDIRRTVRTRLSSLRVPDVVAEKVIGHAMRGIQRVYDHHRYLPEMREALEAWAGELRDIVEPPPSNVIDHPARRQGA